VGPSSGLDPLAVAASAEETLGHLEPTGHELQSFRPTLLSAAQGHVAVWPRLGAVKFVPVISVPGNCKRPSSVAAGFGPATLIRMVSRPLAGNEPFFGRVRGENESPSFLSVLRRVFPSFPSACCALRSAGAWRAGRVSLSSGAALPLPGKSFTARRKWRYRYQSSRRADWFRGFVRGAYRIYPGRVLEHQWAFPASRFDG